jgi:hypothetical protein
MQDPRNRRMFAEGGSVGQGSDPNKKYGPISFGPGDNRWMTLAELIAAYGQKVVDQGIISGAMGENTYLPWYGTPPQAEEPPPQAEEPPPQAEEPPPQAEEPPPQAEEPPPQAEEPPAATTRHPGVLAAFDGGRSVRPDTDGRQ